MQKYHTMNNKPFTRRDFVKTSALGATAVIAGCKTTNGLNAYEAKGLPTTELGKTGVRIPRIAIGCGSRFMAADTDASIEMLEYALENGLYYWDTANNYVNNDTKEASEERLGRVLKSRRKEVFLSTKVAARDVDGFQKQLETSLKRLQTDHLDVLNIHSIESVDDAKQLGKTVEVLKRTQEQGIARFVGFTGHTTSKGMAYVAKNYGLDFMLCALNHMQQGREAFEGQAVPAAHDNGLGVMVMKVIRPRETVESLEPAQLIRYALSLPKVDGAVISMQNLDIMKQNIALLKSFSPMSEEEMEGMTMRLEPFFRSEQLQWMQPGYRDGAWV